MSDGAGDRYYVPGSWFAVVSPRAVVLVENSMSSSRLQAVWETGNADPGLDELVEVITGGRRTGAPRFGIGLMDAGTLRVVVPAGMTAVLGEPTGTTRTLVGTDDPPVEATLDEPQTLRLSRDAAPSGALGLPVAGGIVYADAISWTPQAERSDVTGDNGFLHFSTGPVVRLNRSVIVGRAPAVDRSRGSAAPRPVRIDNLDQDISRSHVEVRLSGRDVLVVDLDSANGTIVTLPGEPPQRLDPRRPFRLVPGATVALSAAVTFSYRAGE